MSQRTLSDVTKRIIPSLIRHLRSGYFDLYDIKRFVYRNTPDYIEGSAPLVYTMLNFIRNYVDLSQYDEELVVVQDNLGGPPRLYTITSNKAERDWYHNWNQGYIRTRSQTDMRMQYGPDLMKRVTIEELEALDTMLS